jgi:hypothetical protein
VEETRSGFMETANVFVATPVFSTIDFIPGLLGIETAVPKEYSFIRGETTLEKWWNTAGEERDSVMGDNFYLKAPAGGCY